MSIIFSERERLNSYLTFRLSQFCMQVCTKRTRLVVGGGMPLRNPSKRSQRCRVITKKYDFAH